MARQKLKRIKEIQTFPNVFQEQKKTGNGWIKEYFRNDNPIVVELGCGKGEFSIEMAQKFPGINFIAVDYKSYILWRGARTALDLKIHNLAFLNTFIQNITECFDVHVIHEIWFTFPDPFPKHRHIKKRLFHPDFLGLYRKILKPGGIIHFKTDSQSLFDYAKKILKRNNTIIFEEIEYSDHHPVGEDDHYRIKTPYERKFLKLGETIKYLKFSFADQ